jgi:hypothetical protein
MHAEQIVPIMMQSAIQLLNVHLIPDFPISSNRGPVCAKYISYCMPISIQTAEIPALANYSVECQSVDRTIRATLCSSEVENMNETSFEKHFDSVCIVMAAREAGQGNLP